MREKQEVEQKLKVVESEAQSLHEENDFLKNQLQQSELFKTKVTLLEQDSIAKNSSI